MQESNSPMSVSSHVGKSKLRRGSGTGLASKEVPESVQDALDDGEKIQCEICGKVLLPRTLQRHFETHNRNRTLYPCTICGKKFTRPATLKYHQAVHGINDRYRCPHCERGFVRRVELRGHMHRTHGDMHPFKCVACDGAFTFIRSLKIHFSLVHGSQQPYRNYSGPQGTKKLKNANKEFYRQKRSDLDDDDFEENDFSGSEDGSKRKRRKRGRKNGRNSAVLDDADEEEISDMDDELWFQCLQKEQGMGEGGESGKEDNTSEEQQQSPVKTPRQNVFSLFEHRLKSEDALPGEQATSPNDDVMLLASSCDRSSVGSDDRSPSISPASTAQASPGTYEKENRVPILPESPPESQEAPPASNIDTAPHDAGSSTTGMGIALPRSTGAAPANKTGVTTSSLCQAAPISSIHHPRLLQRTVEVRLSRTDLSNRTVAPLLSPTAVSTASGEALSGLRKSIWQAISSQGDCS